jgi:hypothetical protein
MVPDLWDMVPADTSGRGDARAATAESAVDPFIYQWDDRIGYGIRACGAVTPERTRGFRHPNTRPLAQACPGLSTGV